jgi:putative ABC transport system permease protein
MAALDRDQPVALVRTMGQILYDSIVPYRMSVTLFGIFAGIALVLASVGIYGVISFSVTRRTHEIGVRMALGARARDVVWMVVAWAMVLTLIGMGIGVAAGFALTRTLQSLLYEVSATDPIVLAAVVLLLATVAAVAGYIPSRRAAGVDPTEALRYE